MEYPIDRVIAGMAQGAAVGNMLREAALSQEALRRAQIRQEHQDAVAERQRQMQAEERDLDLGSRLQSAGRPVIGDNMVEDQFRFDIPDLVSGKRTISGKRMRPVDKSRVLSYTDSRGQRHSVEGYTSEELQQHAIKQKLSEADLVAGVNFRRKMEEAQQELDRFGFDVTDPNSGATRRVMPEHFSGVARGLQDLYEIGHPAPQKPPAPNFFSSTNDAGDLTIGYAMPGQDGAPVTKTTTVKGVGKPRRGPATGPGSIPGTMLIGREKALADTVLANPSLWDNLTPTERGKIAAYLGAAGFTGFGKPMAESAIKSMAETRSAIKEIESLGGVLEKNKDKIGPIWGKWSKIPYAESRKLQADIDRVRQRVGKALEGGVLRKEDEEKYKKILPTMEDVPETALYKLSQLKATLESDLSTFVDTQRGAGHRVEGGAQKLPQGGGKPLDKATGKQFLDAAGGEPAKARQMAKDAGWTF